MRLLVVTPEYPPHSGGGILKYYALMTAAWQAAGARVSVLVTSPYFEVDDHTLRDGIAVYGVRAAAIERYASRLTHLATAPIFRRWIAAGLAATDWIRDRRDDFDVMETTDFGLLFAPIVSMTDRPPLMVKLHGSLGQISRHEPLTSSTELDYALARLTESTLLPSAEELQALSPSNALEWSARLGREVEAIPPPLPVFKAGTLVKSADTRYSAIVAGRIQSWKGPDFLCEAFRVLGSRAPADLMVGWAGRDTASAPDGRSMSAWLTTHYPDIWGHRIVALGELPPADVQQLQRGARFVLVPSKWDTFNYALAESMGLGCLTLGSTGAGASYLIDHGVNGLRFAGTDAPLLAEQMMTAHEAPASWRQELGAAARETVVRELNPALIAERSLASLSRVSSVRPISGPGPWLREFFEPETSRVIDNGHLENVSIRELADHLKQRVTRKVLGS